jgi:Uma2 family endonuclease
MSTIATLVSVEEYLRRTEKPYCEYIDGVLYPKPMPTTLHSRTQKAVIWLVEKQGVEALPELTVRLSGTRFLIPDVIAGHGIQGPYPTEPVLLCVEILSPEDRLGAMLAKCEQYHVWGVPFCWVIDPEKQTGWEYHQGGEPLRVAPEGVLRAGKIAIQLTELFSGLKS